MALAPINPSTPQGLRALKIVVVVMGLAIVACIVVIVATVVGRLSGGEARRAPAAAPAAEPEAPPDLGEISIAIPEGCVIAAAERAGNQMVLRLDGLAGRGCQQVILVDLADGRVTGRITARPEP